MVVADSSTLILLARAGLLHLYVEHLKEKIEIPKAVYDEVTKKKDTEDTKIIEEYIARKDISVLYIDEAQQSERFQQDFAIGKGEAEAITHCIKKKGILLTDDRKAIQLCHLFHISFTTALNIIPKMYTKRKITKEQAQEYIASLQKYGRYSQSFIKKAKEEIQ